MIFTQGEKKQIDKVMDMKIFKFISCCAIGLLMASVNLYAEDVTMFTDRTPSAEEMGNILFSTPLDSTPKMRSINSRTRSLTGLANGSPEVISKSTENQAIGFAIKFALNSAEVLEESRSFLSEIGRMLNLPKFSSEKLIVEGHTDASGPDVYNMYLSKRRAEAVKKYLQSNSNIASERLVVIGKGESQSLPDVAPLDSINRRVQFRRAQ